MPDSMLDPKRYADWTASWGKGDDRNEIWLTHPHQIYGVHLYKHLVGWYIRIAMEITCDGWETKALAYSVHHTETNLTSPEGLIQFWEAIEETLQEKMWQQRVSTVRQFDTMIQSVKTPSE